MSSRSSGRDSRESYRTRASSNLHAHRDRLRVDRSTLLMPVLRFDFDESPVLHSLTPMFRLQILATQVESQRTGLGAQRAAP